MSQSARRPATEQPDEPRPNEAVLITGFPSFTARRMAAKILAADSTSRVCLLTRPKFRERGEQFLTALPTEHTARARLVLGDVCDMDLGLSGVEYAELTAEITTIHHQAGVYYLGVDRSTAQRVNVEGTRAVLELASDCKNLRRFCHWSTASVSGRRKGVIMEDELEADQPFHNFYEETKYQGERLARAAQRRLPITIFRPGAIVGDSNTGEIDKFDGPYYLMMLFATSPLGVRLPLPGRGSAPLQLVPIDYVVDAAYAVSMDERAAGRTFHLTDPNPVAARRVYELVAEHSQQEAPRGFIPTGLARALLRTPGLERIARGPLSFLDSFDHLAFYNTRNTTDLLAGTGVRCPPLDSYIERLVRYVRTVNEARRQQLDDEVFDPFD